MMIKIGNFSHRVKLEKLVRGEDDGFGGESAWTCVKETWAEFLKARVTPGVYDSDGSAVLITQGIRIRAQNVGKGWRISEKGHIYEVLDVDRSSPEIYVLTTRNVRSNLDFQLTKTTTLKANLSGSHGIRKSPYGLEKGSWAESQLWQAAYSAPHDTFLPQYSDGVWGYFPKDEQGSPNSVTQLALHGEQSTTTTRINTDFTLEQDLSFITKGLKASTPPPRCHQCRTAASLFDPAGLPAATRPAHPIAHHR